MLALVELDSIESDALVAKGELILCLKSIQNDAGGKKKTRLVTMGNVLFDKTYVCSTRRAARPVVPRRVNGRGIVPARAAAYGRVTESIDLIAANPQGMLGNIKHHIIIPECLRRVMLLDGKAMFDKLRRPVCECRGAVYGFARSGRDFIMSFAGCEQVAHPKLWHCMCCGMTETDAGAIKRAIKAR